jgi:hypothetical protein
LVDGVTPRHDGWIPNRKATYARDVFHYAASVYKDGSREVMDVDVRDLFEGLDAEDSIALADEIGNRLNASETAIRVLDEISEIIADKLIATALE